MAFFDPLSNGFGLDIGDRTFKLVQVSKHSRNNPPYRLRAWGSIDVPEGVMNDGDVVNMDKAAEYITRLIKSAKGKLTGRAVVACLPETKTFLKIVDVGKDIDAEGIRKALIKEIEQNIPLPLNDIYFDWAVITPPAPPKASSAEKTVVLLGAAPKKLVDDYTALLEKAGLAPTALEIEAEAISRAIIPEVAQITESVGILDIGATRSSLVIYDGGALKMSISIPISGIAVTKLISESLGVSLEDAETLKRECGLDANRCEDKMWKILLPLIDDMTEKIRNALRFYKIGFPDGKKIERLYLCGGGAQFHEIDTVLSRKLTIVVRRGNALANIDKRVQKDFASVIPLTYATAIGLAIRAADENQRFRSGIS